MRESSVFPQVLIILPPIGIVYIKSKETRMVSNTCRYSSGPLILNSVTATIWNIGINCPIDNYLQVSTITLVSLLLIYMIPIDSKIINFSLYLLVYFFENIIISYGQLIRTYHFKSGWRAPRGLIIGILISQYALYSAMYCPLHSNTSIRKIL